jgi:hypothetical protein
MKPHADAGARHRSQARERCDREASLDRTIEASFPASDPPSSDPNPDAHDVVEQLVPDDEDTSSEG